MTLIHSEFDGDAYFPEYDEREWKTMQRIDMEPDDKNPYRYSFVQLQRVG
jgi:dihydrofolate reductase